jgi:uncharacterized protein (DUF1697 family)
MSAYISMLRGINVGGKAQIRMDTLRGIYEDLGFSKVRSYVQSGNVVFESIEQDPSGLDKRIEAHIVQVSGFSIPVFIRQAHELQNILACNPFLQDRNEDPSKLHVTFLYQSPPEPAWSKLVAPSGILDEFSRGELAVYLFCPNGYGKTKLSSSFFERKLGVAVTTRNWNTVNNLYKMAIEQ